MLSKDPWNQSSQDSAESKQLDNAYKWHYLKAKVGITAERRLAYHNYYLI